MNPQTAQIIQHLSSPDSYLHRPVTVRRLQTHASWLFVAPPFVYKIKQPVNLGFLNFITLANRRKNSEFEVLLNRRLAPDIYLGVLALCHGPGGFQMLPVQPGEPDPPDVIEWIVQMRQLPAEGFLLHKIQQGSATDGDFEKVIDRLLRFYHLQPPLPRTIADSAASTIRANIQANFDAARGMPESIIPRHRLAFLEEGSAAFEQQHHALLEQRAAEGWIRDVHGDLHLEHIHLDADGVRIYDCLEFSDSLRQIDVACDIAFLAMDLDFHHCHRWSRRLIERLSHELPDPSMPPLIRWYKTYRACVRGKVEYLRSISETASAPERCAAEQNAARYFLLAARCLFTGQTPRILAFAGQTASGKSMLAEFAAAETGWPLLSSDHLRKTLAGVALYERGTAAERAALYSREMTQTVYSTLLQRAAPLLSSGENVILDATFSSRTHRQLLCSFAADHNAELIWTLADASEDTRRLRLRDRTLRTDVVSDAREEDLQTLAARFEPPSELPPEHCIRICTDGSQAHSQALWLRAMALRQT
jgi:aminoglycoside phosphotransferase family enzyme/predicted kinase